MLFDIKRPEPPANGKTLTASVVELVAVERVYQTPAGSVTAVNGVDLKIDAGSVVAVVGSSGSGKSTLLNIVSAVDWATSGSVKVAGADLGLLGPRAATKWRAANCGVVLQTEQLIPVLTAQENVRLAMDLGNTIERASRHDRAAALLALVGIEDLAGRFPDELSGGQQQRVAIARALANQPALIVADEATAALDSANSAAVFDVLRTVADNGAAVLCSTHDESMAERCDRTVRMSDGRFV